MIPATLVLSYIVLACLLLWVVVTFPGYWFPKLILIVSTVALSWGLYGALSERTGWPTNTTPPAETEFVGAYIREPETDDKGEIDLLLIVPGATHPRLYAVPYSRPLHQQLERAQQAQQAGAKIGLHHRAGKQSGQPGRRSPYVAYILPTVPSSRKESK